MHYAFQDRENLYLVIDIMPGGDLRCHFAKHRKLLRNRPVMSDHNHFYLEFFHGLHASMLGISAQ
jgi:hypothetical protein